MRTSCTTENSAQGSVMARMEEKSHTGRMGVYTQLTGTSETDSAL